MFGFDVVDLIPGGTIEDMVRANGPDLLLMGMQAARAHYKLEPGELMSFQLIEHVKDGKPTIVLLPIVLDEATRIKRKLPYYDVLDALRKAPIAQWVRQGKEAKKTSEKVDDLLTKLHAATARGDVQKVAAITRQVDELLASLPDGVKSLLRLSVASGMVASQGEAPAAHEPAKELDMPPMKLATRPPPEDHPDAGTGDDAPGVAATDEAPATESNDTTDGPTQ